MKKRAISFLLALVMILGFLPNTVFATQEAVRLDMRDQHCNDDYADRAHLGDPSYLTLGTATSSAYEVSRVDITLPELAPGQPGPAPAVDPDAPYTVEEWLWREQPSGVPVDALELDKTYSLEMDVKLKDGYAFAGEPDVYINGEFFDNFRGGVDGFYLWISYTVGLFQYIDEVNVLIDEPELGKPLPQATVPEGAPYHVRETRWIDLETGESVTEMVDGHIYELCVEVAPMEGFRFTGGMRLLLNGTDTWDFSDYDRWYATICKYYPVSSFCEMVSRVDITLPLIVLGQPGPAPTVDADAPYTVEEWLWREKPSGVPVDALELGKTYTLEMSVKLKDGYAFAGKPDVYVNGEFFDNFIEGVDRTHLWISYTVDFAQYIDEVNVLIDEPELGKPLPQATVPEGAPYHVLYTWWIDLETGEPVTELVSGASYELRVEVASWEGFAFTGGGTRLLLNGTDDWDYGDYGRGYAIIGKYYPVSSFYETVNEVHITVPEAVPGEVGPAPAVDPDAPYTVEEWAWHEAPSGVPVDALELGKTYSLEMSVKLKDGYDFAGEPDVYVNGEFFDNFRGGVDGFHLWISYGVSFVQHIDEVNVLIDEPELGKPLPQATVPEGAPYVLETWWIDLETGEFATEPVSGASYKLRVEVASWEGFAFTDETRLLLNGTDDWDYGGYDHRTATIDKYYPVSFFCEMVNEVHITVPEAVPGDVGPAPVVAPDAPYEIAQAFWYDAVTFEPAEILAANGNYYLEISLEPKAGYAFTDTVDIYFNGEKYDDGWADATYLRAQYFVSVQTIIDRVELTVTRPFAGDAAGTVTVAEDAPYYLNDKATEWGASDVDNLDDAHRVVAFESGQYAWIAADLLAKDGYFFSTEVEVYVNGQKLSDSGAIFSAVYEIAVVENLGLVTERPPCGSLLGDVNLDGFVDSMDTNILFRYANEDPTLGELTAGQLLAADANQDSFVDSMDTNILFRYANEDPTLSWIPMEIQHGKKTDEE